jgi:hypothetical protein
MHHARVFTRRASEARRGECACPHFVRYSVKVLRFDSLLGLAFGAALLGCPGEIASSSPDGGAPRQDASENGDDSCCGTPTVPPANDDAATPNPSGCVVDWTYNCESARGYACTGGANPSSVMQYMACTAPQANGATDDYCCFQFPSASDGCLSVDTITTCPPQGPYPFRCVGLGMPDAWNASMSCFSGTPDPDGVDTDYCCSLNN